MASNTWAPSLLFLLLLLVLVLCHFLLLLFRSSHMGLLVSTDPHSPDEVEHLHFQLSTHLLQQAVGSLPPPLPLSWQDYEQVWSDQSCSRKQCSVCVCVCVQLLMVASQLTIELTQSAQQLLHAFYHASRRMRSQKHSCDVPLTALDTM